MPGTRNQGSRQYNYAANMSVDYLAEDDLANFKPPSPASAEPPSKLKARAKAKPKARPKTRARKNG